MNKNIDQHKNETKNEKLMCVDGNGAREKNSDAKLKNWLLVGGWIKLPYTNAPSSVPLL